MATTDISQGVADQDDGLGSALITVEEQEATDAHARHIASLGERRIVLPEGASQADAIYWASKEIPNNEYGLPEFFYRSDFLPADLGTLTQSQLDTAAVHLDYSEGYPTFNGAHIFWNQLPHEPRSCYEVFLRYLEQAEDIGIRQLALLAQSNVMPLEDISRLAKEFYWTVRARAYDLFQVAADKKRREIKARRTETKHFDMAESLVTTLQTKFEDPDWMKNLEGKELVQTLMELVKLQRISLGLSINGNAGAAVDRPESAMSAELIMRKLTQGAATDDGTGVTPDLAAMMLDPEFTMAAQELIFRVTRGTPLSSAPGVE